MTNLFGGGSEFGGDLPLGVFEFLNRFQKAADDHNVSGARGLYLLPGFTKEPSKWDLLSLLHSKQKGGRPGEISFYLEMVNWLLTTYATESNLHAQEAEVNSASQDLDEDENAFYTRLREIHAKCWYIQTGPQFMARFVQALR